MIWANLLHLSYNMWCDRKVARRPEIDARPEMRYDVELGRNLFRRMAEAGMNMVVLDIGDAIQFQSHPEISVPGAWTHEQLRAELATMRGLGLEPIPKLNFSASHDTWMGEYARMVSTAKYYEVCRHLIEEVTALFDTPRFFHIGMDEEDAAHQKEYEYVVIRQHDLWWRDLQFYVSEVERHGVRAWMWADYVWNHEEAFFKRMPKTVVQSNWYYGEQFCWDSPEWDDELDPEGRRHVQAYLKLAEHGYDQIPTCSNWTVPPENSHAAKNTERTVEFCRQHIAPQNLLGFMTAPWHPTLEAYRGPHEWAVDQVAAAKRGL